MKQVEKLKKIITKGRGVFMVHKTRLDPDGDPCIKWVAPHLQKAHLEYGWEVMTTPPVEAKKTRTRKPKTVKNVDTKE